MTREQAKKLLIKTGVAEPTDVQISEILNSVMAEVNVEKEISEKYKTDAEKYSDVQKELDDLKKSGMSDVEKALAAAKKAQEDAETLKADYAKKASQMEVEKIFVTAGLKNEEYEGFIGGIVGTDAEASKKLAQSFADTISKQRESAIAQTKKDLLNNTGSPDGNEGGNEEVKTDAEKLAETSIMSQAESNKTASDGLERFK